MADLHPKFIIEGDSLIISKVSYHRDIVNDMNNVNGGGWFVLDYHGKEIIFHGTSQEFGTAKIDDIRKCIESGNVYTNAFKTNNISKKYKFIYATDDGKHIDLN